MMYEVVTCDLPNVKDIEFMSLEDKGELLSLLVAVDEKLVSKITFDTPLCYRVIDEGDAMMFVDWYAAQNIKACILKFTNSEFLSWFFEQGYNSRTAQNIFHYCIVTNNHVVDVVSFDDPEIISGVE